MEDLLRAVLIGIIQGLTEFLPVSSSGHIELGQAILGLDYGQYEQQFSVILHAATALSTIVVFRKDIAKIILGLFQKNQTAWLFSVKIILSMMPAAIIGIAFEEQIDALFSGRILLVGSMLLVTGCLLFLADRAKNTVKKVSFFDAIVVGLAQAIAILPGISRSGATISTSVLLGIDRTEAARFSFLMVVPLILGKMAKDILDGNISYESSLFLPFVGAFIGAFLTGLFACIWMIELVKRSQLKYFAFYCIAVGLMAIGFTLWMVK